MMIAFCMMILLVGCGEKKESETKEPSKKNVETLEIYKTTYNADKQFGNIINVNGNCRLLEDYYYDDSKVQGYYDGCVKDIEELEKLLNSLKTSMPNSKNKEISDYWAEKDRAQLLNMAADYRKIADVYYSLNSKNKNISGLNTESLQKIGNTQYYRYMTDGIATELKLTWAEQVKKNNSDYRGYSILGTGKNISEISSVENKLDKICQDELGFDACDLRE